MYSFTRSSTEGKRFALVVGDGTGIILSIVPCLNDLCRFDAEDHDVWDLPSVLLLPVDLVLVVFRAEYSSSVFANELHHNNVLRTTADAILDRIILFLCQEQAVFWFCFCV
jgi:hypothetical protein